MTPQQKELFDFIKSYISNRGFAPTYKEIMQATDIRYKSQCFGLLKNLERQGKITIDKAKARGISICKGTVREKEQIKRLQKQLDIAQEALGYYSDMRKYNKSGWCSTDIGYKKAWEASLKIKELNK